MGRPHENEGGACDIFDVTDDVCASLEIIDGRVAHAAARTAYDLYKNHTEYAYVEQTQMYSDVSGIVAVGTYSPIDYSDASGTLFGDAKRLERARSFMSAVKSLARFSGMIDVPDYVKVMLMEGGSTLPEHSDRWDGSRAFLQLSGMKVSTIKHPYTSPIAETITEMTFLPGSAYMMQFRSRGYSVPHTTHYFGQGNLQNIAIYIDPPAEE